MLFRHEYSWLSNFAYVNVTAPDGFTYPTVEHAYQAAKTDDEKIKMEIAGCESPGKAKRLARKLKLPELSVEKRLEVMEYLLRKKFNRGFFLNNLIGTGDLPIIEENYWGDKFWGVDADTGVGENHLGKIIMKIRDEKRKGVKKNETKDFAYDVVFEFLFDEPTRV